ncbi:MAG: nitrate reductase [Acidiferrobacteraceae bacterium]|nr:nitrate reductase [Acidiferrobacteraceae bacterium]|tara:strand:- start:116 stop:841 length:726 start_codon:yes stop_codon:yes gene_type:complete
MGIIFSVLFYAASVLFVVALGRRIFKYATTPAPLVIPTTPAPMTWLGVIGRMLREVVFFESLFKGNKWTWLFGWLFHFGMLIVLVEHLRYVSEPVWFWVASIQWLGPYGGMAMFVGLAGLWVRRLVVDRVRYISVLSDHLMLGLMVAIVGSGLVMVYVFPTDIVMVKSFMLGLIKFDWQPLPSDPPVVVHLVLTLVLMIIFPFSKLLHAPGVFFSPTRNMRDNPRERRHTTGWRSDAHPEK